MKVERTENEIKVASPYLPKLPRKARALKGSWNGAQWVFNIKVEEEVAELYESLYGFFETPARTIDVEITLYKYFKNDEFNFAGRLIANRKYKAREVILGPDCFVIKGQFPICGGSVKNPHRGLKEDVTLKVLALPENMVEKELEKLNADSDPHFEVKILSSESSKKEKLLEEKATLLKRLSQIEDELKGE
jgi:hypothetical protein